MDGEPVHAALLDTLVRTDGPSAERALIQALDCSRGAAQSAVLRAALGRGGETLRSHLAARLPRLDAPARQMLLAEPSALEALARAGVESPDPSVRGEVVALIDQSAAPSCAYLLVSRLGDADARIRRSAAGALARLVERHRGDGASVDAQLAPALTQAMRGFLIHQQLDVLRGAILLGARCPAEVFAQIDTPRQRLGGLVADLLRQMPPEQTGAFVFGCLRYRRAGLVARAFLAAGSWTALAALGEQEHWLALRFVRESLGHIRHLKCAGEEPQGLLELPADRQGPALRLAMACGLSETLKDTLLDVALAGERAAAGAALPFVLARRPGSVEAVLIGLHSPNGDVQALTTGQILVSGVDRGLAQHLLGSLRLLTEPTRTVLSQFLAADGFEKYWRSYHRLSPDIRGSAGRALLKLDGSVRDLLAGRLAGRDVGQQLQAVQMIRLLGLAPALEPALCRLARQASRTVRSAAVAALGGADSFAARATLGRCLHDRDSRVQANAVEALYRMGGDCTVVLDKLHSDSNRVRANALRWLLSENHPRGREMLAEMLSDGRAPHRISALWVVRTLHYTDGADLLEPLVLHDADAKVRARAATLLRRLRSPLPAGEGAAS